MANYVYTNFMQELIAGNIDLDTHVIKCALVKSTPTGTGVDTYAEISAIEVTGTNYATGGKALETVSVDGGKFDALDLSWSNVTFDEPVTHAVIYDDTASGKPLLVAMDLGGPKTVTAGTFTLQWNSNGIFSLAQGS